MDKNRWMKGCSTFFIICFLFFYVLSMDAMARVGGGRSFGSRGSRPSAPSRPYSTPGPTQPSQSAKESPASQPSPQPTQQPQSGLWRGIAGGVMGGILGGMLFRGLGFGSGTGGSEAGIGFFEILLIAALLFGVYYFFKRRRQAAAAERYYQQSVATAEPGYQSSSMPFETSQPEGEDPAKGLGYIRQMDPSFEEKKFLDSCMDQFFRIQGAWAVRDMSGVRNLLTEEMFSILCGDADKLKQERKINKVENIAVRSVDIGEVWQESGRDYITVKFYANLLDYTVDEGTGQVVSGSRAEPVKFEEYWTFTRSVGNRPWQLSAINQPA